MALTISQACAVNTLCNYLCEPEMRETTDDEAREALKSLAAHADKVLASGFDADLVEERWHGKAEKSER